MDYDASVINLLQQNVHNGILLYGHKPEYVVSIRLLPQRQLSAICKTTTLRHCCSCSFKCFKNRSKSFSYILLL